MRQGTAQQLSAAIVIADLCGFTAVADRTPAERLVAGLNEHLGAVVEAVERHSGQVLKFLGDGLLAVFSLEERPAAVACGDALAAAEAALAANAGINRRRKAAGQPVLDLDVALHMGEVMYGNVGAPRRLDFTVVGPAVNEASRIEALCEPLGCHVLTSAAFARGLPAAAALARPTRPARRRQPTAAFYTGVMGPCAGSKRFAPTPIADVEFFEAIKDLFWRLKITGGPRRSSSEAARRLFRGRRSRRS